MFVYVCVCVYSDIFWTSTTRWVASGSWAILSSFYDTQFMAGWRRAAVNYVTTRPYYCSKPYAVIFVVKVNSQPIYRTWLKRSPSECVSFIFSSLCLIIVIIIAHDLCWNSWWCNTQFLNYTWTFALLLFPVQLCSFLVFLAKRVAMLTSYLFISDTILPLCSVLFSVFGEARGGFVDTASLSRASSTPALSAIASRCCTHSKSSAWHVCSRGISRLCSFFSFAIFFCVFLSVPLFSFSICFSLSYPTFYLRFPSFSSYFSFTRFSPLKC